MQYEEYKTKRKPYQETGYLLLLERKHACLFYSAGKGKTYPVVDALQELTKMWGREPKTLILSTSDSIKNMWNAEIVPQRILPTNTTLLSFTAAIQDKTKAELRKIKWDVIVVDESHKIKSHNAKSSKLVYELCKKAEYAWGLTGTPRGNSDVDIYCQLHNLCVDQWGSVAYTFFVDTCCEIDQKFFRGNMIKIPTGILPKYKAGWERNLAINTQRVDYDDDDDMPALNVNVVKLPFEETPLYKQAKDGFLQLQDYETTMTKLVAIQKMHQIANGFVYGENIKGERTTTYTHHNIKIDWLLKHLDKPTTVVYRFEADYELITMHLSRNYITYTDDIDLFKAGGYQVLLLQCGRCESFNLQMCKHMVFFTMDYSYLKYDQMLHRVWRTGQEEDVTIDVLLFQGSIEESIWNAVSHKEMLAKLFMRAKGEL